MNADLVSLIEAAYLTPGSDEEWLKRVLEATRPVLDRGRGLLGYLYDASSSEPGAVKGSAFVDLSGLFDAATMSQAMEMLCRQLPPALLSAFFRPERVVSTGRTFMRGAFKDSGMETVLRAQGIGDVVGIIAANPDHTGVHIAAATPTRARLSRRDVFVWTRLAAHISAGFRLRRLANDRVEAVLRPDGGLAHAEGPARSAAARATLQRAATQIDRARGPLRRCSPEEAVELWRALVAGRWSLVEQIDTDGRRYLIARSNDPGTPLPASPLSRRQQQVLAYAAMGHSNKAIAYQLGLSTSTVATHLASAASKLGVRSRVSVVQTYRQWAAAQGS